MKIEACINLVDELIKKDDEIISKGAKKKDLDSLDIYRGIRIQTLQLIRTLFPDADKRIQDYEETISVAAARDGAKAVRKSFIEQVKANQRYLVAIKDSLKLRESVEIGEEKLDNLKMKLHEKEVESERREKVTETKFYGAAIEIIDRLRDQLKNEGDIKQEILSLKTEIKEIKEILKSLHKGVLGKQKT